MQWIYRGRCWKFGDNVGIDGDMMPLEFALKRELDPEVLKPHFMCGLDPEFPKKVKPGDLIVAGRRFGQGNPHIQGFIGLRGHGVGLLAESIPRGSFRNAINAGVPFLTQCAGVTGQVETGDDLEVDFQSGRFVNHTRGTMLQYEPLDGQLLAIIALGGWKPAVKARIERMSKGGA